jgi:hypothetical protein
MPARRCRALELLFGGALLVCNVAALADQPVSRAEDRLFLANHLGNLPARTVLRYAYSKGGSLEVASEDTLRVSVTPANVGSGRQVSLDYLTGTQKFELPGLETATANPVVLFFLERDIREMQRRTGGQAAYFRKRIRMALADAADVHPVTFEFDGHSVTGDEITVHPYRDDPLKMRFEQLADKTYRFTLSDQVPGMLYRIQTVVRGPASTEGSPPLIEETLSLLKSEP